MIQKNICDATKYILLVDVYKQYDEYMFHFYVTKDKYLKKGRTGEAMIKINNLRKEFKVNNKESFKDYFIKKPEIKQALNISNLEITEGERIGLVGLNGSGKSTLIKCILGIIAPTKGTVSLFDNNPVKKRRKVSKDYGAMFGQRSQLKWDLPAIETYKVLKSIYDISDKDYNDRLQMLFDDLHIEELVYKPVRSLSLGQKVRVEIGAVFLHNPKLLVLDEPTIGLDFESRKLIIDFIKNRSNKDNTLIMTSHNILDIDSVCNRLIVLHQGRVLYDGEVKSVLSEFSRLKNIIVYFDREVSTETIADGNAISTVSNRLEINNIHESDVEEKVASIFKEHKHIIDVKVENIGVEQVISLLVKRDNNV